MSTSIVKKALQIASLNTMFQITVVMRNGIFVTATSP